MHEHEGTVSDCKETVPYVTKPEVVISSICSPDPQHFVTNGI